MRRCCSSSTSRSSSRLGSRWWLRISFISHAIDPADNNPIKVYHKATNTRQVFLCCGPTRMPQTSGLRGQIPPSSRISKEIRIADTATTCARPSSQDDDGMSQKATGSNPGPSTQERFILATRLSPASPHQGNIYLISSTPFIFPLYATAFPLYATASASALWLVSTVKSVTSSAPAQKLPA